MSSLVAAANHVDEEVPEGHSVLAVLDPTGDTKLMWDRTNEEEVEVAREHFNSLIKKGFSAYSVNRKGEKGELIREFDPAAEKIIMAPRLVGG